LPSFRAFSPFPAFQSCAFVVRFSLIPTLERERTKR
jgi:hypothetical protein